MLSVQNEINANSSTWVELEEDFDIATWSVFSTSALYVQEYGLSGWSSSISISASTPYYKQTSVKKIRIKTQSGTASVNYSLVGLIVFRVNGTSGSIRPVSIKYSDYTLSTEDYNILVDTTGNSVNISLPSASINEGQLFNIKCIDDTNTCLVDPYGTEEIDGDSTSFELIKDESITIQSDGIGWRII